MPKKQLLLLLLALLALGRPGFAQNKTLTIDDLYDPEKKVNFAGTIPQITWAPDGRSYLQPNPDKAAKARILKVDAATGKSEPFFDAAKMEAALGSLAGMTTIDAKGLATRSSYDMNAAWTGILLSFNEDLYYYDIAANRATRLTSAAGEETNTVFSPDGRMVAFVRANDLYVVDVATQAERRLTTDGSPTRLNGRLDWVYEEELYGRGQTTGYWWSPDSAAIAYLSFDETKVPDWVIPDDAVRHQAVEMTKYPKAGDPNPEVRLGVVRAGGGPTTWMDLSAYEPADMLIVRVAWAPQGRRLVYQVQNRIQNWLELVAADTVSGGKPVTLFKEASTAWVEVIDNPVWLANGSFLWQSERSGFRHIYLYGADGRLLGQVTKGDWDVRGLSGATPDGWVYFTAAERSPLSVDFYRVKLDGSGMARLTAIDGHHSVNLSPQFTHFVDVASTISTPAQTRLFKSDGTLVRVIEENKVPALAEYRLGTPEFLKVKTRDGFEMEAMMIKPPDFDPSKKYPVMSYAYAGPGAQQVRNAWGGPTYLWHQMLAQKGYIIWVLDNRSASAKGVRSAHPAYRNLGEHELRDLEDGVSWLKTQSYVDGSRIGLWGWSYGGFITSYALTHSDSFKIGIAGAPVTDWHNYDSIYTERYMGLPGDNREGYRKSSVVGAAANLKGKLLLIHGAIDDNVHKGNSTQLIDALQKAGKQFEYMVYPQSRHGVSHPARVKHMRTMMTDFIVKNL